MSVKLCQEIRLIPFHRIIDSGNYVRVSMNVSKKGCSGYSTNTYTATADPSSQGTTELHAFNDPYNSTYIGHQVQH